MAAGPFRERGVFSPTFFTPLVRGSTASPGATGILSPSAPTPACGTMHP
jgi:hypothetical protein